MTEPLPYNERPCLRCGKPYKKGSGAWWGYCEECGVVEQFYQPLPKQAEFHASTAKYRLYAGGFGSGKTLCGCQEAIQLALRYPNNFILIGAQTYTNLRDTTQRTFLEVVPEPLLKGGKLDKAFHKTENAIEFYNGSVVIFRSMDEPNKYKSLNLGAFYIDELTEVPENVWLMLESRLRNNAVPRRTGFATTNPEGGSWVYAKFVANNKHRDTYAYFQAPTTENVYLPEDYVQGLLASYSESWVRRYIYADWSAFEGQIFPDFEPRYPYVVPHHEPEPHHMVYVGIDHGIYNPTAAVWAAVNPINGDVYVFQEYYKRDELIKAHADTIKFMSSKYPVFSYFIDPSTQNRNAVTGQSVRGEYLRNGVPVVLANNDILAGIHKMSSYLKKRPDGTPKLTISEKCVHLIEELGLYRWEKQKDSSKNAPEKPHPYKDHSVDALRYLIMGLPQPGLNNGRAYATEYVPKPMKEFYNDGEGDWEDVEVYSGLV